MKPKPSRFSSYIICMITVVLLLPSWIFIVANADSLSISVFACLWLGFPFALWFFLKKSSYSWEQPGQSLIWLAYVLMLLAILPATFLYMGSWIFDTQTSAMDGLFVIAPPFLMLVILGVTFLSLDIVSSLQKRKVQVLQSENLNSDITKTGNINLFKNRATIWFIRIVICAVLISFTANLLSWFFYRDVLYKEIQKLYKAGEDISAIKDVDGKSFLHQAALRGDFNSIQFLISVGADVNTRNLRGDTPLFDAAYAGSTTAVRLLLEADAEINSMNNFGQTPLIRASRKGHVDIVQLLLSEGADPNLCGDDEWPPLMKAVQYGYIDVAQVLLKNGADITYKDSRGNTPLSIAHRNKNKQMIDLLMQFTIGSAGGGRVSGGTIERR